MRPGVTPYRHPPLKYLTDHTVVIDRVQKAHYLAEHTLISMDTEDIKVLYLATFHHTCVVIMEEE